MRTPFLLLLSSILVLAQDDSIPKPDGVIVPFTSVLPACASECGPLFDVQGGCSPPATTTVSDSCFCADSRLKPLLNSGTAGIISVCGTTSSQSCSSTSDWEKIQTWYADFCGEKDPNASTGTTTTSTSTPSSTSSTGTGAGAAVSTGLPASQTWLQGHWKYIIMLVVMVVAITGGWFGAIFLRRRYIRKKEREIEMRPPVSWGPPQMQGATGGFSPENGIVSKEAATMSGAAPATTKTEGRGWLSKLRS